MNKDKLERMRNLLKVQGMDGNWNYNEYMLGMYNGMELMLSVAEDRQPDFAEKPESLMERTNSHE